MKIAGIVPFRNESFRIKSFLENIEPFCDLIIGLDDNSMDSSADLFQDFGGLVIRSKTNNEFAHYGEYAIRTELIHEARRQGATHFLVLDMDESLNIEYLSDYRKEMQLLEIGQSLSMRWVNLYGDLESYIDCGIWQPTFKPFAFRDTPDAMYPPSANHFTRVPFGENLISTMESEVGVVLHSQFLPFDFFELKQCAYRIKEFLYSNSSARGINSKYKVTKLNNVSVANLPLSWFPKVEMGLPDFSANHSHHYNFISDAFKQHGVTRFEKLDIWEHPLMINLWHVAHRRGPRVAKVEGVQWEFAKILWKCRKLKGKFRE